MHPNYAYKPYYISDKSHEMLKTQLNTILNAILNIQYTIHNSSHEICIKKCHKRGQDVSSLRAQNSTKYAIYNYAIMQDTITDIKHQKSTHVRPIGLPRIADKSSQVMMKHSHHTVYKAYLATTGEKAKAAYSTYLSQERR